MAPRPAAGHHRLPRRPDRERPHRPLPDSRHDGTVWQDGPLTRARAGRARSATSTRSSRRARTRSSCSIRSPTTGACCRIDKTGELLEAAPGFQLVVSYNPGYQRMLKDLKPSTRQRFVALDFDFPPPERRGAHRRARKRRRTRSGASRWSRSRSGCARCATAASPRCRARACSSPPHASSRAERRGASGLPRRAGRPADRRPRRCSRPCTIW